MDLHEYATLIEEPYPNEHAVRVRDPEPYIRFRRQNDEYGDGIHAVWGVRKGPKGEDKVELQALRFDADKFTVARVRAWLKKHPECEGPIVPAKRKQKEADEEIIDVISEGEDLEPLSENFWQEWLQDIDNANQEMYSS